MTDHRIDFAKRLNEALDEMAIPVRGRAVLLASKFEVSAKAAGKWLNGESIPEMTKLIDIALWLGKGVEWLLTGSERSTLKENGRITDLEILTYEDGDPIPDGYMAIDFYDDVYASAGGGYLNIEQPSAVEMLFPINELRKYDVKPEYAKVFIVDGESMVPDLYPGQRISIDTSAKKIYDGEIYAFLKGDELKVKILFDWDEMGKGGFKAVSRNPDKVRFPDEYYSPARIEADNIQIVGQYWWKAEGRRVRR
ncbi:helix-turn-helix transcriptional regulator [Acinetobacter baumannii]|uniref:S24 family peptidase n=1 Tax=Acinetobacter baumannii TaxID=470 RepID=UPI000F62DD4A|nr:S24 family peptidase [Acinetobacter baumannii]AZK37469.1 helix-turn-helix transcriptional regulator [Acinetobacter baumannii]AZK41126.1 helix-turn-helix transcriptional regulator [Acinetobacter baumannii]HAV2861832.1 helix-turn-helix transcriptional regulator [Acinetobacter baumannii]HAV2900790.1 helix-turn-helix transcriptional regulator [Acinetobacter baumannii]HAV2927973.1 helix-turn-helix transcriptional regulator [Acinetobacter baumannii]